MLTFTARIGKKDVVLDFEHSLLSLSKWEAKHKRPFMSREPHPLEDMIDYFGDMLVTPGMPSDTVYCLSPQQLQELEDYIADPQTASTIHHREQQKSSGEIITSELIYAWMTALKIPYQPTDTWHLNRAMMLIQMRSAQLQPAQKRPDTEVMKDWRAENEKRKALFKTNG